MHQTGDATGHSEDAPKKNFRQNDSFQLIITHQILKFAGADTDIWLNSPTKCHSRLYNSTCTSILARRIFRRNHEFLMHKLYMHTLLKSGQLLKNHAVIKVCLGPPSAQSDKVFRRTHKVAIIPLLWRWSGLYVPSVFRFHSNLSEVIFQQTFLLFWAAAEKSFQLQNLSICWGGNDAPCQFSDKFEEFLWVSLNCYTSSIESD